MPFSLHHLRSTIRHLRLSSFAVTLALLAGCGDSTPAAPQNLPQPTFGDARLTGRVTLAVDPPPRKLIERSADQCHVAAKPAYTEQVVVGADKGLANTIVYLKGAPASDGSKQPAVVLDQHDCRYSPHVVAVQVSQPLRVITSDPVYHNTRWDSDRNGDVNFDLKAKGDSNTIQLVAPEFIRFRCDAHPWMEAWVGVMSSPFFAVTDADGNFTIDKLPAGKYTLATWHEFYGETERPLEVIAGERRETTIEIGK